jgi:hypothetical protein
MSANAGNMSVKMQMQIIRKADRGSGTPKNMNIKIGKISPKNKKFTFQVNKLCTIIKNKDQLNFTLSKLKFFAHQVLKLS